MTNFKIIFAILLTVNLFSQNINEIPLFGKEKKTLLQTNLDKKFIEDSLRTAGGDKVKAAKYLINKGWQSISANESKEAIKRFNQAYLIDPSDYQVYWGLGVASTIDQKFEASEELFLQSISMNSKDSRLQADYIFSIINHAIYFSKAKEFTEFQTKIKKALDQSNAALKNDPTSALLLSRRAMIHFYMGDLKVASEDIAASEKHGGEGLDPRFVKDVQELLKQENMNPSPKNK